MSKWYVDSKISNLHDSESCALSKNKVILYAKTTDISDVLTIIEVFENVIIVHAHSAIILRILVVDEVSENRVILYVNFANISATIYFLNRYASILVSFDFHFR